VQGALYFADCLSDRADWFRMTRGDAIKPTPTPVLKPDAYDRFPDGDETGLFREHDPGEFPDIEVASSVMGSDASVNVQPGADRMMLLVNCDPAVATPATDEVDDAAETLSIPTLDVFGILILILLLGACLSRIGRARS